MNESAPASGSSGYGPVYEVVRRIPEGRVATYGQVAVMIGRPRHARLVGYALHALAGRGGVPWHRVVNHRGGISTGRAWPGGELEQRLRLEAEGVRFDSRGRVDLRAYGWVPEGGPDRAPKLHDPGGSR